MGSSAGPSVASAPVLYLDAGNAKSYPGSGTAWTDLSGIGNTGTLTNGPTYNAANGGSIVFDGVDDYVNIASVSGPTNKSLSLWIKPISLSTNYQTLIEFGTEAPGLFTRPDGKVELYNNNPSTLGGVLTVGTWAHIVYTSDSSSNASKIYINGVQSGPSGTANTQTSANTRIGGDTGTEDFNGLISSAVIYNRALSAAEIKQNFNALRGRYGL